MSRHARHATVVVATSLSLAACAAPASPPRPQAPTHARAPAVEGVHAVRIPLRSQDEGQIGAVLREVLGVPGSREVRAILEEPETHAIVVVGTEAGIEKVRQLLSPALLGDSDDAGVEIVRIEHADAARLAHAVERVAPGDVRLVVDEATNALVVAGPSASRHKVRQLARELDTPGS